MSPREGGRDYIHPQILQSGKSGGRCSLFSAPREVLQHRCHAEDLSLGEGSMKAVVELVSGEKTMMKGAFEGLKNHLDLEINSVFSISRKQISSLM